MARTRYQEGMLRPFKNKSSEGWRAIYRVDEIEDGKVVRKIKTETLYREDYPTEKLAKRRLAELVAEINDPEYRARPNITFKQFAEQWMKDVLPQQKPSYIASESSRIRKHLIPFFADVKLKDFNGPMIQGFAAKLKLEPKTVENVITTLQSIWGTAEAWGYVHGDPFKGLRLKESDLTEQPCFSPEDARKIIAAAPKPYNVVFWLVWETGIRRGEVCALNVGDVDLELSAIVVKRSRWGQHITDNKSRKPRAFALGPELCEALKPFVSGRNAEDPLFLTPVKITSKKKKVIGGRRLHPDNFVKRILKPIVEALKLEGAMHAFRHGNATFMDRANTPMAVRQSRLGHAAQRTTMRYTHLVSEDERKVAAQLGAAVKETIQ